MNEELYQRLLSSGVSEAEATQIAKSYIPNQDVDTERLTKALQDLRDTMATDTTPQDAGLSFDAPTVDSSGDDVIGAITKGADAILMQNREHIEARAHAQDVLVDRQDAIAKSLLALGETVERIEARLNGTTEEINKGLELVAGNLNTPSAPRSVQSIDAHPAEDVVTTLGRRELISKALGEMQATQDWSRKTQLGHAVSLLESGEDVKTVVSNYNLAN